MSQANSPTILSAMAARLRAAATKWMIARRMLTLDNKPIVAIEPQSAKS